MNNIQRCQQAIRKAHTTHSSSDLDQRLSELDEAYGSPVFEAALHNLANPQDPITEVDDNNWQERGFDSWNDADRFDYQCDKDD